MVWAVAAIGVLCVIMAIRVIASGFDSSKRLEANGRVRRAQAERLSSAVLGIGALILVVGRFANNALVRYIGVGLLCIGIVPALGKMFHGVRVVRMAKRRRSELSGSEQNKEKVD